jgi:hypothetical protein
MTRDILEGVQKLIRMWEAGRLTNDEALAFIELHLERENDSRFKREDSMDVKGNALLRELH